jgi:hypothetical protein
LRRRQPGKPLIPTNRNPKLRCGMKWKVLKRIAKDPVGRKPQVKCNRLLPSLGFPNPADGLVKPRLEHNRRADVRAVAAVDAAVEVAGARVLSLRLLRLPQKRDSRLILLNRPN